MKFVFRYTARFLKSAEKLFSAEELMALELQLMDDPTSGAVIPGAGGLRKVRFAAKGKGTRGGARVVYLLQVSDDLIVLAEAYAKSAKEDLTADELKNLRREADE